MFLFQSGLLLAINASIFRRIMNVSFFRDRGGDKLVERRLFCEGERVYVREGV